jgi:8-oxo-dGTP diphosphatase
MKHSVTGLAFKAGKVFIAHRTNVGQMANRWEFPGGKVEAGEDYKTSLIREFEEEFSAKISVGNKITTAFFEHNNKKVKLHAYEVFFAEENPEFHFTEHTEAKWATFDEILKLDFVDSDMKVYPEVRKYFEKN